MAKENQQQENKTAEAHLRRLRVAPRKSRMVTNLIKDMSAEEARAQLSMSPKRASSHVLKLLNSAIANAENNHQMNRSQLVIDEIRVDEGPTYKRWMPRAFGRATPIHKKTSHIHIKLKEDKDLERKDYIVPEKEKKKKDKPSGKSGGADDYGDAPMEPKDTGKPTSDKSNRNPMQDMFRRKSV